MATDFGGTVDELDRFYLKYRPRLRRSFHANVECLRRLSMPHDKLADAAHRITLASEHLYLPERLLELASSRGEIMPFARVVFALSRVRTGFAIQFVDAYPAARWRLADAGELLVEQVRGSFLRLKKPSEVLAFCFRSASTEQFAVFVTLFGAMATHAPDSVPAFFELFERVRKAAKWNTIRDWIARGVDLVSSGRTEEGISFLLGLRRESREMLGVRFAVLSDRKSVLHIFCASFGGRVYGIHDTSVSIVGLSRPYTDGTSIYLPETIDLFGTLEANESAYTVLAALQASHVRHGSFSFDEARIGFSEELQRRYGTTLPLIMDEVEKQYGETARTVRERERSRRSSAMTGSSPSWRLRTNSISTVTPLQR